MIASRTSEDARVSKLVVLVLGLVRRDGIQDSLLRGVRRACFLLRVDVGAGSSIWLCLVGIFM